MPKLPNSAGGSSQTHRSFLTLQGLSRQAHSNFLPSPMVTKWRCLAQLLSLQRVSIRFFTPSRVQTNPSLDPTFAGKVQEDITPAPVITKVVQRDTTLYHVAEGVQGNTLPVPTPCCGSQCHVMGPTFVMSRWPT